MGRIITAGATSTLRTVPQFRPLYVSACIREWAKTLWQKDSPALLEKTRLLAIGR
jgi:hypothetical protein